MGNIIEYNVEQKSESADFTMWTNYPDYSGEAGEHSKPSKGEHGGIKKAAFKNIGSWLATDASIRWGSIMPRRACP